MLGHCDAGFTLRTYTHATRQAQDEAAERMGELHGAGYVSQKIITGQEQNFLPGAF